MKFSRKILFLLIYVLVRANAPLFAGTGISCSDPIVLTPGYQESISGAATKWYMANTFDLPLAIAFYPSDLSAPAPKVELDFSCTPGVYEDSILCSLFCSTNSAYIALPYRETLSLTQDDEGTPCYRVEFGEFYRDMLLKQGIDYNVEVYVKAIFSSGGSVTMEPDAFNECMDGPKFMHYGDTVQVQANDISRHVIVPYVQWQYDSIRYVWQGTEPCQFAVGNKCGFDPTDFTDGTIIDRATIQPGGQYKVSSRLLMEYVSNQDDYPNDAGMYFAKFYSTGPGVMTIEKIPAPAPSNGAVLLKYGVASRIEKDNLSALYAIPDSWIKGTKFFSPTGRVFKMYVGTSADFTTSQAIAVYQFDRTDDGHQLCLTADQMQALTSRIVSNYLYVRFECSETTSILASQWEPSDCVQKATRIQPGVQFSIAGRSTTIFSLYYEDWMRGDMTIAWTSGQAKCAIYIADTCAVPNAVTGRVFYDDEAPKRGSTTISKQTIQSWEPYIDADGYLYIRFYSTASGKITVSTSAPAEMDPTCILYDSVATVTAWTSPYLWRGRRYSESGEYSSDGNVDETTLCMDTLYTLRLTMGKTSYDSFSATACDSVVYQGRTYTESGVFKDTIMTSESSRTIVSMDLSITPTPASEERTEVVWDSLVWEGQTYKQSGDYVLYLSSGNECEYTKTLHLTVKTTSYDTYTATTCDSVVYNNKKYTQTGAYKDTILTSESSRTIVSLNLSITPTPASEERTEVVWDSLVWEGQTYKQSGDYVLNLSSGNDCGYTKTLHLTVHTTTYESQTLHGCKTVEYKGKSYTEEGTYADTIPDGENRIIRTVEVVSLNECPKDSFIYFCKGLNHERTVERDGYILHYQAYTYEEPGEWVMEGAVVSQEGNRTLVDLKKAEANIYAHYTDGLTPVQSITWSHRANGATNYTVITATDTPQWIDAGALGVSIRFICGESYYSDYTTQDIDHIETREAGQKAIIDGRLVIIRGGVKYSVLGQKIEDEQ